MNHISPERGPKPKPPNPRTVTPPKGLESWNPANPETTEKGCRRKDLKPRFDDFFHKHGIKNIDLNYEEEWEKVPLLGLGESRSLRESFFLAA